MSDSGQTDFLNASPALLSPQDAALAEWRPRCCGLVNLGGCNFMNANLQCLLHTTELSNFFLRGFYKKDMNVDNPLGCKGALAESFHLLLDQTHSHSVSSASASDRVDGSVSPHGIMRCISDFTNYSFIGAQPDSHELIAFLLDGLHEDLNRVKRKPCTENVLGNGSNDANDAREAWERYKTRNDSFIADTFHSQTRRQFRCSECNNVSVFFEPTACMSLAFERPGEDAAAPTCLESMLEADVKPKRYRDGDGNCPRWVERS
jgi:ubiquitin carboxyl-terminal hydrolase 4/11/15